ncbi:hypothetical protein GCM10009854_17970 [Saccharopolyspora halophila]|uniref:Uncharacterized protein n=1 Tax=Saccharopolyspora halophila TaxID=405551 RepID=A0ABN3G0W6_9PSEU
MLFGLARLAIPNSPLNVLPNVFFSLISGLILLALGLYGRMTGRLPAGNPYRLRRERGAMPEACARSAEADRERDQKLAAAELAIFEGIPLRSRRRWYARNCADCSPRSRRGSTIAGPGGAGLIGEESPRGARAAEWRSSASSSGRAIRSEGRVRGAPSVHR